MTLVIPSAKNSSELCSGGQPRAAVPTRFVALHAFAGEPPATTGTQYYCDSSGTTFSSSFSVQRST
ncbi:MAG: hypothetical protein ACXVZH_11705, partial [Terriglobales bacterium]